MVGQYTVRDDGCTVTVEKFLFNTDTGTDRVTPTNTSPTRDIIEVLHDKAYCYVIY